MENTFITKDTGFRQRVKTDRSKKTQENIEELQQMTGKTYWTQFVSFLSQPEDPSNLAIFRILFGILMLIDIPQERGMAMIDQHWGDPTACYFPLFNWLAPLPLDWMYVTYIIMVVGAFGILLGCFFRTSCLLFLIPYWYIFLLDKSSWNNHSYLYGLFGIILLLTDSHRYCSIDGLLQKSLKNTVIPRWNYWLIKFQIVIVYFFAGLKKLDLDWMSGYSMVGLSKQWVFDPFRLLVSDDFIELYMVHICGLLFDLLEGFLLFFDTTRGVGLFFGSMFHIMNSQMFSIGMFPYAMMATMPVFFSANWPKHFIRKCPGCLQFFLPTVDKPSAANDFVVREEGRGKEKGQDFVTILRSKFSHVKRSLVITVALCFVLVQLCLPWSHFITKGYNGWTNGLYGYSWDMMVHSWSTQHIRVKVVDKITNQSHFFKPGVWIGGRAGKRHRWTAHPDMIKQYALCLQRHIQQHQTQLDISDPAIYIDVWRSMNNRFQQRLFDPQVDIITAPWSPTQPTPWLLPLLIDLSPWRVKLREIEKKLLAESNSSEVVFVADFPGLFLENFVHSDMNATLTVLQGKVIVEQAGMNVTLGEHEGYQVMSNGTHVVHTVSEEPASWMYYYTNTTLANNATLQKLVYDNTATTEFSTKWENLTMVEKSQVFIRKKVKLFSRCFLKSLRAVKNIVLGGEEMTDDKE